MSLQELDNKQATEETSDEKKPLRQGATWMERNKHMFPNFFTPKVVANRGADIHEPSPLPKAGHYCEPVTRKLDRKTRGRMTHVMLHIHPTDKTFTIKSISGDITIKVSRAELLIAIAHVHGSPWVSIRFGTETYRLNRTELKNAFVKLEAKTKDH